MAGRLKLHRFLPGTFVKSPNWFAFWMFGTKNKEQKELLRQIIQDTDPAFVRWAISKITTWNNRSKATALYHIHGSADTIFPVKYVIPDVVIEGGGHFMVYDKHEEVSKLICKKMTI